MNATDWIKKAEPRVKKNHWQEKIKDPVRTGTAGSKREKIKKDHLKTQSAEMMV